jgi:hypothetical protein
VLFAAFEMTYDAEEAAFLVDYHNDEAPSPIF